MPMTLAHPAAVLPLRRLGERLDLSMTAMVAGSTVPDLPLFLGRHYGMTLTHSWWSALSVDPLLGSIAVVAWFLAVRDPLVEMSPAWLQRRLAPHVALTPRQWLLVPVAGALGSITHLSWDEFTHGDRFAVARIAWLHEWHDVFGGMVGYEIAQYVSGVVGLAVVVVAVVAHLWRLPARFPAQHRPLWGPVLLAGALLAGLGTGAASAANRASLESKAFYGVVDSMVTTLVVGLVAVVLWRLLVRPARPQP